MIVYKDLISGDEMMTDAFPQNPVVGDDGETVEGMFEVRNVNRPTPAFSLARLSKCRTECVVNSTCSVMEGMAE